MANNKINKDSLLSYVDTVFVSAGEMVPDNGEDSYAYAINDKFGFIAVFDGCGGIGSRKYDIYDDKTGAYIASHAVAKSMIEWFEEFSLSNAAITDKNAVVMSEEIYKAFCEKLKGIEDETASTAIKGSLTKNFPTTASMIVFKNKGNRMNAAFLWAGDSRGYLLTNAGLNQVTVDDVEGEEDALSNLTSDARLSNMVCAAGDFKINSKVIACPGSGVLISATDGCFGYFRTPMEFEYMLLKTLAESDCIDDWNKKLNDYMRAYTGDDYTLAVAAYGYKSFRVMKKMYAERERVLYSKYISKLKDSSEGNLLNLWEEYREGYYING